MAAKHVFLLPVAGNFTLVLTVFVLVAANLPWTCYAIRHHLRRNQLNKTPVNLPEADVNSEEESHSHGASSKLSPAVVNGGKTHHISNEIAVLPRFAEPVSNLTVVLGRDAILPCVVDNLHKYKVAWVRVESHSILTIHNRVITRNYRISLAQADGRHWVLRISNVHESDRGWYMCQINTDPMRWQKAYVEVVVPPDITDHESSADMTVREGANATLTCKARGYPTPFVLWRREDGATISYGQHKFKSYDGESLPLSPVSRLHMGAYLCIASNGIPPSVSKRIMLSVQFPPMIWIPHQLEGTTVGQEVNLVCKNEAYPPPIMYWTNEREDMIVQGEKYSMVNAVESDYKHTMILQIRNVSTGDFKGYRCVVRNSLGETDGLIRLYEILLATKAPKTIADSKILDNHVPTHNYPIKLVSADDKETRKISHVAISTAKPLQPRIVKSSSTRLLSVRNLVFMLSLIYLF